MSISRICQLHKERRRRFSIDRRRLNCCSAPMAEAGAQALISTAASAQGAENVDPQQAAEAKGAASTKRRPQSRAFGIAVGGSGLRLGVVSASGASFTEGMAWWACPPWPRNFTERLTIPLIGTRRRRGPIMIHSRRLAGPRVESFPGARRMSHLT